MDGGWTVDGLNGIQPITIKTEWDSLNYNEQDSLNKGFGCFGFIILNFGRPKKDNNYKPLQAGFNILNPKTAIVQNIELTEWYSLYKPTNEWHSSNEPNNLLK